ncbi:MAG: MCE family protein [Leptospiraceae bacterium]|nr:MCE family protein [Leptospiraceae bacterium]MCP5501792.1 MCE family protein [Leptospiraceae bacterium]
MGKKTNYYKVGLFVISGLSLVTLLIIMLGARNLFQKKLQIETYFDESIQGLDVGSHVKYRGVTIGSIKDITFVQDEYNLDPKSENYPQGRYILVKITLKDVFNVEKVSSARLSLEKMIEAGLRIKINPQGLTGTSYLELDYVDQKTNPSLQISWKPNSIYIPSTQSTIKKIGASIDGLVQKIDRANVEKMLEHIDKLVVSLTTAVDSVKVNHLSQDAGSLLKEIRLTNNSLRKILSSPELQNAPQKLDKALTAFAETTNRLNTILTHNNYDINSSIENLRLVSEDMKEITGNAKKYPSLIFFGEKPGLSIIGKK